MSVEGRSLEQGGRIGVFHCDLGTTLQRTV